MSMGLCPTRASRAREPRYKGNVCVSIDISVVDDQKSIFELIFSVIAHFLAFLTCAHTRLKLKRIQCIDDR